MELTTTLLSGIIVVVSVVLHVIRDLMSYWKKRGIPHNEPSFLFGNMKGATQTRHQFEALHELYEKYKGTGPFCGMYFFLTPAVLALDMELINRGVFYNEKDDPLSAHLFAIEGEKWRQLRNKLTQTFSSGKMKFMFPTVVEVGNRLVKVFGQSIGQIGSIVEMKEMNARFTTDVILTCIFGIECNSLTDPNDQFRVYGRKMFAERRHSPLIISLMQSCPNLARKLGMKIIPSDIETFFMTAVKKTVAYREKNDIRRNDFMDILIDLKNKRPVKTESGEVLTGLTMEEVAAQAFVFYLAGFETSSSTLSYALYELALNPEIQDRLRAEINEIIAKHGGELTYDGIKDMRYMGQVIEETLRMYSIVTRLQRIAKEDYDTGDPKYKIEKGTVVLIPSEAIHFDPEIYPNPKKFDPERFTPEEKQKRETVAWLPFGRGPRNCIGLRFGEMQSKIGLTLMIKNFRFSVCEKTQIPLKIDIKQQALLVPADGIYLKAERI